MSLTLCIHKVIMYQKRQLPKANFDFAAKSKHLLTMADTNFSARSMNKMVLQLHLLATTTFRWVIPEKNSVMRGKNDRETDEMNVN